MFRNVLFVRHAEEKSNTKLQWLLHSVISLGSLNRIVMIDQQLCDTHKQTDDPLLSQNNDSLNKHLPEFSTVVDMLAMLCINPRINEWEI